MRRARSVATFEPSAAGFVNPGRTILERLPDSHLTRSSRAFSLSLTTTVFSQRSTGWFSAYPRRADAGGPAILHLSHSTAYGNRFLHQPPPAFVTHNLPRFDGVRLLLS